MQGVDVWDYPHPFSPEGRRRQKLLLDRPRSIEEVKAWTGVTELRQITIVNGTVAAPGCLVRDGDVVSFHVEPEIDPATIAFFLIDLGVSGAFAVAAANFIVAAAVSIAVSTLVSTVFAADVPELGQNSAGTDVPNAYSVSSANNSVRGYQPLPLLMGNVRFSPDIDCRPWTQFVDDPQNIRQQTVVQQVTQLMTAAYYAPADDVSAGGWVNTNQPAFNLYPGDATQYGYLEPWAAIGGGIFRTRNYGYVSQTSTDYRELFYNNNNDLYGKTASGPWTPFDEAVPSYTFTQQVTGPHPETTQELTQVFNFGMGDLTITDVRLGQTKVTQFNGLVTSTGTMYPDGNFLGFDAAHPNPPYGGNTWKSNVITVEGGELRQNVNVADSGWVKRDFYGTDAIFIQVDISGRLYYSGNNGPELSECAFEIAYRVPGGAWILVYSINLNNGDAFPVRETYGWAVAYGSSYEVRVRKITTDSTDARLTQDFECPQIKFFRAEGAEANNPFTQHPAQNRYAIAVRAGGQINGTINDVNAYCTSKCWVWTGGAGSVPTTPVGAAGWSWENTENPAWWYLYYSMGGFRRSAADAGSPLNGKGWCLGPEKADGPRMFGAGLFTERIDLETLAEWARFCTAYNLRFNAVLREQSNVAEVLNRISRIGRGSPTWQNGKLGAVWEDPAAVPVAAFGVSSIKAGSMTIGYIGYNSPDEIVANYTNPDDDWKEDEVRKTVPGVVLPNSVVNINLFGCIYKEQAQREVNLLAARQFYQRRRVTFNTSQEGLPIVRGDVILLAHDMTNWAFTSRVGDATAGSSLALVRRFEPLIGATLSVLVVKPDGTMLTGTAAMPAAETHVLALNGGWAPIDFSEYPDAVPEDWVVHLSTDTEVGKRMRVVAVEPGDGRDLQITCTDERVEMWQYENSGTPTTVDPSEEALAMRVIGLSINRDPCTEVVCIRWENINCRKVVLGISINGGTVGYANIVGEQVCIGNLAPGSTIAVNATPVADAGTQAANVAYPDSVTIDTDEIGPANSCQSPEAVSSTPLQASVGVPFSGTVTLTNATSATITNLPAGLTQSTSITGGNLLITISGTPTAIATTPLLLNATNDCGGGLLAVSVVGLGIGNFVVGETCLTPTNGNISATTAVVGVEFSAGIILSDATSATVTNLPVGLTQVGEVLPNGNYRINITGTPQGNAAVTLLVNATNACGSAPVSITGSAAGTLTITGGVVGNCTMPSVTWWSPVPSGKVGTPFEATLLVSHATTAVLNGLPPGLTQSGAIVANGNYLITVTGTPTVDGTYPMTVDATNACGGGNTPAQATGLSAASFTVEALPVNCPTPQAVSFTNSNSGLVGQNYTNTLSVANATSASISGLPPSLSQSSGFSGQYLTITITGTLTTAGSYPMLLNATNACGGGSATATLTNGALSTFTVEEPVNCPFPSVSSGLSPLTAQVGVAYSGSFTVLDATTVTVNNLPAGLSYSSTSNYSGLTVTISGTPTTASSTTIRIDASNVCNGGINIRNIGNVPIGTLVISA